MTDTCRHGHELTPDNIVIRKSRGRPFTACRTCKREATQKYNRQQRISTPRMRAMWRVGLAVRAGRLLREPCLVCGSEQVHAHHPNGYDFDHALDVVWLCPVHHAAAHKAMAA